MTDEYYHTESLGTDEWNYMWGMLAKHPVNLLLTGKIGTANDPTVAYKDGETWEYMDTSVYEGELKHCFRHREHPVTNRREYIHIPVSKDFRKEK